MGRKIQSERPGTNREHICRCRKSHNFCRPIVNYPVKNSNFRCCCRPLGLLANHVNVFAFCLADSVACREGVRELANRAWGAGLHLLQVRNSAKEKGIVKDPPTRIQGAWFRVEINECMKCHWRKEYARSSRMQAAPRVFAR